MPGSARRCLRRRRMCGRYCRSGLGPPLWPSTRTHRRPAPARCEAGRDLALRVCPTRGTVPRCSPVYGLSLAAGTVVTTESSNTLADGMATRVPDADALAIIRKGASRIVQVSDGEIAAAIRAYWTDTHNLAEGAGAAALAAALQDRPKIRGKRVGLILSGGNIDFDLFNRWVIAEAASPAGKRALV